MIRNVLLVLILTASAARADRGALSVDIGVGGVATTVPALDATPPRSTLSFDVSTWLGGRYALSNHFELSLTGFFEPPATLFQNGVNLETTSGTYPGTTRHQYIRFGAQAGFRFVFGMRFRFHIGVEAGWCQQMYSSMQHFDVSNPSSAVDYGLMLPDRALPNVVVSPLVGIEWVAGDSWSLSIVPRGQVMFGQQLSWAVILPLQFSWSWYL